MLLKPFNELSINELYAILRLRQDVFVVEQDCVYADIDGADTYALHLFSISGAQVAAYLRIFEPGVKNEFASVGRIIVQPDHRGTGLGGELIREGIRICKQRWPGSGIYIEAQAALMNYYHQFGFREYGEVYEWDGIDHIKMICP